MNGDRRHLTPMELLDRPRPQYCTGFVIDAQRGIAVTATCAPEASSQIEILLASGEKREATFIGKDETSNVSVFRIAGGAPALSWTSAQPQTGARAITIGYSFGLGPLISSGVIAGQNLHLEGHSLAVTFVDTPVERGMAGSPVMNMSGEVIGMVCAIYGRNSGGYGGYAVMLPSTDVRRIAMSVVDRAQ